MHNYIDVFRNSINISKDKKYLLNRRLNAFFEQVVKELDSLKIPYNLYLSGSLARGEPSILCLGEECKLISDIDFVLVVKKTHIKLDRLDKCLKKLKMKYIKIDFSILVLDVEKLNNTQSTFGRDLRISFKFPIRKMMEIEKNFVSLSPNASIDYFECFIYQVIKYLFFPFQIKPKNARNGIEYIIIKLILESFKLKHNNDDILNGYFALHKDGAYLTKKEIEINEYILYRELFNITHIQHINLSVPVLNNLKEYFNSNDDNEMMMSIMKSVDSDDFLFNAQNCFLSLFMSYLYNDEYKNKYYNLFRTLILKQSDYIDRDTVKHLLYRPVYGNNINYKHLLSAIFPLKDEYTRILYKKNTGIIKGDVL